MSNFSTKTTLSEHTRIVNRIFSDFIPLNPKNVRRQQRAKDLQKALYDNKEDKTLQSYRQELCSRLEMVLDMLPSRKYAAVISGRSDDMITAYAKGRTDPPFYVMKAIADAAGVSLDWLATGEGEQDKEKTALRSDAEETPENLKQYVSKTFADRHNILTRCIEIVDEHPQLERRKRAELIFLIADKALKDNHVDEDYAKVILSLTK